MQSLRVPAVMSCWGMTAMGGTGGMQGRRGACRAPPPPPPPPPDFEGWLAGSVDRFNTYYNTVIRIFYADTINIMPTSERKTCDRISITYTTVSMIKEAFKVISCLRLDMGDLDSNCVQKVQQRTHRQVLRDNKINFPSLEWNTQ